MKYKCPYCRSSKHWKWNPPTWMKWTPGSMANIRCSECGHEYCQWCGIFSIRHGTAHAWCILWHWILGVLALALAVGALILFMGW